MPLIAAASPSARIIELGIRIVPRVCLREAELGMLSLNANKTLPDLDSVQIPQHDAIIPIEPAFASPFLLRYNSPIESAT
jgi:hypothetical protein